jgi:hypothetical protein
LLCHRACRRQHDAEQHGHDTTLDQPLGSPHCRYLTPLDHLHPPSAEHHGLLNPATPIVASTGFDRKTEATLVQSHEPSKTAGIPRRDALQCV